MSLAVASVAYLIVNGESNWFEGVQLLALYTMIAVAYISCPDNFRHINFGFHLAAVESGREANWGGELQSVGGSGSPPRPWPSGCLLEARDRLQIGPQPFVRDDARRQHRSPCSAASRLRMASRRVRRWGGDSCRGHICDGGPLRLCHPRHRVSSGPSTERRTRETSRDSAAGASRTARAWSREGAS